MHDRTTLPSAYLHTIDLCLLRYNRERCKLEILLHQRDSEPFAGHWALPGIVVNGEVVNIPSYLVKTGDVVAVREKAKKQLRVQEAYKLAESIGLPGWVQVDGAKLEGVFKKTPDRDEFGSDINESLIVELYSR